MLSKDHEKVATVWVCTLQGKKERESKVTAKVEGKD